MKTEVLVVGGGLAGCAAAIALARSGTDVTLVERDAHPQHKVCGEFLSGEALLYLQRLSVEPGVLGAVSIERVRLAVNNKLTESTLPFAATSLTRRRLDGELLLQAEAAGARVCRGHSVEKLQRDGSLWQAVLSTGETITANTVFLASGKHDVRGHSRAAGSQRGLIAFKMYWRLCPSEMQSLARAVELITYPGGYAGLQPVDGGVANLSCLIHADRLRQIGGGWATLLAHMCKHSAHLRQRLLGGVPQLDKPLTIAPLPYGFVRTASDGPWYVGDQAVVIPSFTGDGMSIALHSGVLAAAMYLQNASAHQYQQTLAKQVQRQVRLATMLSKAVVRCPALATVVLPLLPGSLSRIAQWTRIDPAYYPDVLAHVPEGRTALTS